MERFLKRTARIAEGQIIGNAPDGARIGGVRFTDDWTAEADVLSTDGVLIQRYTADRHTGTLRRVM
ncbi:MAG: hypothetical protein ISR44_06000 [Rhodospirillales bacterium]|nr:hypothetical protein [Rhodospirillales bacterium]